MSRGALEKIVDYVDHRDKVVFNDALDFIKARFREDHPLEDTPCMGSAADCLEYKCDCCDEFFYWMDGLRKL